MGLYGPCAACLNLLIVALAFTLSAGYAPPQSPFAPLPALPPPALAVGLLYGAYVSLVVAAAAVIAAVLSAAVVPAVIPAADGRPAS